MKLVMIRGNVAISWGMALMMPSTNFASRFNPDSMILGRLATMPCTRVVTICMAAGISVGSALAMPSTNVVSSMVAVVSSWGRFAVMPYITDVSSVNPDCISTGNCSATHVWKRVTMPGRVMVRNSVT